MEEWMWVHRQEAQARAQNNTRILNLVRLARAEGDGQQRLQQFDEGLRLATQYNLPCWKLYFHRWIGEMLFYDIDDLPQALKRIVHMAAIAPQPEYQHCPSLARALFIVVDIYYEIEPLGYEQKILAAIDYMEAQVALTPMVATHCTHRRGELAYHNGRYNEAIDYAQKILASRDDAAASHRLLRTVYFAQGDIPKAFEQAQLMERANIYGLIDQADALLWQAALAQRMGNPQTAHQTYLRGQYMYERNNLPRWIEPYDAISDYLEMSGDADAALKVRAKQVEIYKTYGSQWYESHANLEYCRLLGRMEKPLDNALPHAQSITAKMVNPTRHKAAIQRIENGDYHQFAWQK